MSKTNVFQFKSPNKPPLWPLRWPLQTSLYFFHATFYFFLLLANKNPPTKTKPTPPY